MPDTPARTPAGLSIFFPAYNDSGTIASMVVSALLAARALTPDHEVIVVNDGSKDGTPLILDELARMYSQVRIVHHQKNRGYGGALRSGFEAATKEYVFYTDGDAQYDPAEVALLWQRLGPDVDLVNGYKISRSDPFHRIVIGRLYHHTVKLLFGLRVRDVDCACKLFRREALIDIRLASGGAFLSAELLIKLRAQGRTIVEAGVPHHPRTAGRASGADPRVVIRAVRDFWRLRLLLWARPREALRTGEPALRSQDDTDIETGATT